MTQNQMLQKFKYIWKNEPHKIVIDGPKHDFEFCGKDADYKIDFHLTLGLILLGPVCKLYDRENQFEGIVTFNGENFKLLIKKLETIKH